MNLQRALKRVLNRSNLEVRQAYFQITGQVKSHGLNGYAHGCRCDTCCFSKKLQVWRLEA